LDGPLPVRAESVTVSKQVVVYGRAVVRRGELGDVARLTDVIRREQLGVSTEGKVQVAEEARDVIGRVERRPSTEKVRTAM